MKNSSFFKIALIALAVALYSCSDKDDNPVDEISEELIIKSYADAANIVKGLLKAQSPGSGLSFIAETLSEGTVSFEGEETSDGPLVSRFDIQPNNYYVGAQWAKLYPAIASANEAIEKISAIAAGAAADGYVLTEVGKNTALGGLYFVRGLSYFYLVRLHGKVPLYTTSAASKAGQGVPAEVNAIYTQIEADFKKAEELLPTSTGGVKTVPSKYAAEALLARVYLTWAQYSAEGDLDATPADQTKLNNAVTYADKVINSGQYSLLDDFTKNWGRNNKNGQEHIYNQSYVVGDAGPGDGGNHQSHCAFSYGFDADPNTQPAHIGPSSYSLYTGWDGGRAGNDIDQRREFSYTAHLLKPGTTQVYEFLPATGWLPLFGKGIDRSFPTGPIDGPTERDLDRIEIRYADVLLIKAEALIELNRDLGAARDLINQVRRRAYIQADDPTAYDVTATTQAELRTAVREEIKHEFVYEQRRWFDLVRWHTLVKTVQTVSTFPEYSATPAAGTFFAKLKTHLQARYTAVTGSGTKYYTLPYPETATASNPNLKN
ncbi:MAG: RagB/SusD family nutrient uptake outer membrane protein [Prevotellaceae bacterium]|jgi:hypothetical protein|nr:RagB/SusD family nutrient uptake outer membrane protein [Prevotellaceae bacterium]